MRRAFRPLLILKIRHTYVRDGAWYYQRRIPKELQGRYPSPTVKHNLHTSNAAEALQKVKALDRRYEAEWEAMLADPTTSPEAARIQALELLRAHGLVPHDPDPNEYALDGLTASFEAARIAYAGGCDLTYREADPRYYLNPVQAAAVELLSPMKQERMADALAVYLQTHPKGQDEVFKRYATSAVARFVAVTGDKPVEKLEREDAHRFKDHELQRGQKTTSVRRQLNSLNAIFSAYMLERRKAFRERGVILYNPFESIGIQAEGEDAETGVPLSFADWRAVARLCRKKDDDVRWLVAIQLGTGARIAEVAGLTLEDIQVGASIPHIIITANAFRGVKGDRPASGRRQAVRRYRAVPLVGPALWAAQRVVEEAVPGQVAAFPRYVDGDRLKAGAASATVGKWLKVNGIDHSSHDFRHTVRDLLRRVECPDEIVRELGGWSKETVANRVYGEGHQMQQRQKWLSLALALPESEQAS